MPASEIRARLRFRCKHRHNGLSHNECYNESNPAERVGFLDIEATSLNADFGYVLCYCIRHPGGPTITRSVTPADIRSARFDKPLMQELIEDLKQFDRIVTYFGTGFDNKFLRTRCLKHNVDFPPMGSLFHFDLYFTVRNKLKLHRSRLETVCDHLGIPSKGHRLTPDIWMRCQAGDQKAIDYVKIHCEEDVLSLDMAYHRLEGHFRLNKTSV